MVKIEYIVYNGGSVVFLGGIVVNMMLFGDCLSEILIRKDISVTDLALLMGYRSRTSVVRIVQNKANGNSLSQFLDGFEKLGIADAMELEALQEAMEVSRKGLTKYRAWKSLSALLHDRPQPVWESQPNDGSAETALESLIALCNRAKKFDMLVINCCWDTVFERLTKLLERRKSGQDHFAHYFTLTDDTHQTVRSIAALLPTIFSTRFQSFALHVDGNEFSKMALHTGNMISCVIESSHGSPYEVLCMFQNEHTAIMIKPGSDHSTHDFLRRALNEQAGAYRPLVQLLPPTLTAEDYLQMTEWLEALEWKRNLYSIEGDLCLRCVHPNIVMQALDPKQAVQLLSSNEDYESLVRRFYESQSRRFDQVFVNKSVKHMILSKHAMQRFAETGRLQVHFFALRAFTVSERIDILRNCLNHAKRNGYFNIYFRKDDEMPMTHSFSLLERHGLLMYRTQSEWNPQDANVQAILDDTGIVQLFAEYFRKELLQKHVLPYGDGIRFMESLIVNLQATQA